MSFLERGKAISNSPETQALINKERARQDGVTDNAAIIELLDSLKIPTIGPLLEAVRIKTNAVPRVVVYTRATPQEVFKNQPLKYALENFLWLPALAMSSEQVGKTLQGWLVLPPIVQFCGVGLRTPPFRRFRQVREPNEPGIGIDFVLSEGHVREPGATRNPYTDAHDNLLSKEVQQWVTGKHILVRLLRRKAMVTGSGRSRNISTLQDLDNAIFPDFESGLARTGTYMRWIRQ